MYNSSILLTYTDATAYCNSSSNGWLVTVDDATEFNVIASICDSYCYIGYNDIATEGVWVWQHGDSNYTNWSDGEPESYDTNDDGRIANCAVVDSSQSGRWSDLGCESVFSFICETDPLTTVTPSYYPTLSPSNASIITTIAGTGDANFSGDDGDATNATVNGPAGIVVDVSGNVYFCDLYNNRVRKVTVATGIITTYAGTGSGSHSGDGDQATSADLYFPNGLGIDSAGIVYLLTYYINHCNIVMFLVHQAIYSSLITPIIASAR